MWSFLPSIQILCERKGDPLVANESANIFAWLAEKSRWVDICIMFCSPGQWNCSIGQIRTICMNLLRTLPSWLKQEGGYRTRDFGVATGLVAVATLINLLAWPHGSSQDGHYFALVAAVLLSALAGGLAVGLFATALAGLSSSYFVLAPQFSLSVASPDAIERLSVFLVEGALFSVVAHVMRNYHKAEIPRIGSDRYLAIPLAAGAATVVKILLPDVARDMPFAFNYAAVCICAWTGGILPGVLATALLAGLTRYLFLEPLHSLSVANPTDSVRVALFVAEGVVLSTVGASHTKLKLVAARASIRARAYMAGALSREQDSAAIRAISRDTIWEWGLDTGEILRTPSWQDALSSSLPVREEFTSWVERIHPEDRSATVERLQDAIVQGRQELQYTYRLLSPRGTFLSVSDHAFIVRGNDWKPLRVIGRSAEVPARLREF
jgi:PAS domain-containing protein